MIIGLTGGIGSGKTTVSNYFAKFENVLIYNADLEAKKLMNTSPLIKTQLIKEFGVEAFLDNQLNRPFISKIVFKDKEKLKSLNAIVHPAVKKHFQEFDGYELVGHRYFTQTEHQELLDCRRQLWRIRFALHLVAGRSENRLLFDYQADVAKFMKFGHGDNAQLAVEKMMRHRSK